MITERLIYEVLSVVAEIPSGKVATYGQIARLIGREKNLVWWVRFSACPSSMDSIRAIVWSTTSDELLLDGAGNRISSGAKEYVSRETCVDLRMCQ